MKARLPVAVVALAAAAGAAWYFWPRGEVPDDGRLRLYGNVDVREVRLAFRAAGQPLGEALLSTGGLPLHVAGTLRRETWGGRERIELTIEDAADPRRQH